ncbi:hypothetical protein, partial [Lutibacter sp.]
KPVTQEVMVTYFKQQNNSVSNEDTKRWFKEKVVNESPKTIVNTTETPNTKRSVKPQSNLAIQNTKVIIKNNSILDSTLSLYIESIYNKTTKKYTLTGDVSYIFRESTINNALVVCNLSLTYSVKFNKNNKEFDSGILTSVGSGFSNFEAKQNAISKIIL